MSNEIGNICCFFVCFLLACLFTCLFVSFFLCLFSIQSRLGLLDSYQTDVGLGCQGICPLDFSPVPVPCRTEEKTSVLADEHVGSDYSSDL